MWEWVVHRIHMIVWLLAARAVRWLQFLHVGWVPAADSSERRSRAVAELFSTASQRSTWSTNQLSAFHITPRWRHRWPTARTTLCRRTSVTSHSLLEADCAGYHLRGSWPALLNSDWWANFHRRLNAVLLLNSIWFDVINRLNKRRSSVAYHLHLHALIMNCVIEFWLVDRDLFEIDCGWHLNSLLWYRTVNAVLIFCDKLRFISFYFVDNKMFWKYGWKLLCVIYV